MIGRCVARLLSNFGLERIGEIWFLAYIFVELSSGVA